jgi:RNA polymerase sigma-70 factor (ECF subfamily)
MLSFNTKKENCSDSELIRKYREDGDIASFEELFFRYSHLIFCVCLKYLKDEEESKDTAMEIFEKIFADLKNFEIRNFKSWLYATTRNCCRYKIRKRIITNIVDTNLEKSEKFFMEFSDFDTLVNEKEIQVQLLEKAFARLKENQQTCLRLFFYEKKSYLQISAETGFTEAQVKSFIQNGKRNLKNFLIQHEAFKDVK